MSDTVLKQITEIVKASEPENEAISVQLSYLLKERRLIARRILHPSGADSESDQREYRALFDYMQDKIRMLLAV